MDKRLFYKGKRTDFIKSEWLYFDRLESLSRNDTRKADLWAGRLRGMDFVSADLEKANNWWIGKEGKASMVQTDMVKGRCRGFGEEKQTAFEKRARAVSADWEEMMEGTQVFRVERLKQK